MKKYIFTLALVLLSACQSAPRLEDDTRYVKLASVVEVHEFSEVERKQAQASSSGVSISIGIGVGVGTRGSFGDMMFGMGMLDIDYKISSPVCGGSPPLRLSKANAASRLPRFARS